MRQFTLQPFTEQVNGGTSNLTVPPVDGEMWPVAMAKLIRNVTPHIIEADQRDGSGISTEQT